MLLRYFILMPCAICLLLLIVYITRRKKSYLQKLFMTTSFLGLVYLFADACYVDKYIDTVTFVVADIFAHFAAPILITTAALIIYEMHVPDRKAPHIIAFYAFAVGVGLFSIIPLSFLSWEEIEEYINIINSTQSLSLNELKEAYGMQSEQYIHYFCSVPLYHSICGAGMLADLLYCFSCMIKEQITVRSLFRFLFKGEEYTPFKMICWVFVITMLCLGSMILLGRFFFMHHPFFSIFIAIVLTIQFYLWHYTGLLTNLKVFTLGDFFHPQLFFPGTLSNPSQNDAYSQQAFNIDEEHIRKQLYKLMHEQKVYRNPNITIEDVASQLGTNRMYVSQVINQTKNLTFREYLNYLRLSDAKEYMLANPNTKQEEVARSCGFPDAASFNKRFRQQEGMPPREWLTKQQSGNAPQADTPLPSF